jgi:hypothetical protein
MYTADEFIKFEGRLETNILDPDGNWVCSLSVSDCEEAEQILRYESGALLSHLNRS